MTTQERFAKDWGMDVDRVQQIVNLAKECGKLNEHAVNGDPHPKNRIAPGNKTIDSNLWEHACGIATADLVRFVESYGFTVVYTGLYPTLKKSGKFVEIPY